MFTSMTVFAKARRTTLALPEGEGFIRETTVKSSRMARLIALVLLLAPSLFGQAAAGNEKYEQNQYAEAANAYERIPAAQRNPVIYNRLGISYHLSNQLRAAETAY